MIIAILLAAAAAWGVLALTAPPGPGLDPDAMSYLGSAQSLAAGHGLRIPTAAWDRADSTAPLSHFPPGFPLALAAGVRGGLTPINAARLIEALAAAVTAAAVFLALVGAGSLPAGLLAVVALAVTPAMLIVHASVLSEPPYLAITTLVIWQLARAPRAGQRPWVLGALATAGVLTRYAGVALVIAVVLDGWWREGDWRTRLRAAFEAAVIPLIAMAFWLLSRAAQPEGAPVRRSGLYLAGLGATIREGGATVTRWLAPGVESPLLATATAVLAGAVATATAVVAGAVAIALVGRFAFTLRAEQAATADRALLRALALVALSYMVVLVASRLLADGDLPLDEPPESNSRDSY